MRLNQKEITTRRRGLGKESESLAFKPRNKEHNVLIPMHCQSAFDVVGLMQIKIAIGILEHVSHAAKRVTRLLNVPTRRRFRPFQDQQQDRIKEQAESPTSKERFMHSLNRMLILLMLW